MCDTAVAVGRATANGTVIFAKNSDRHPNECQPLLYSPRRSHAPGAVVRCQYLELPQVSETWEIVGGRPWWLWGFETGLNEWGVAVGNEAVLSREPYASTGLLGMDLVRLGLERGRTAYETLRVITDLLERYGQGGSAQVDGTRYYHNAFIIADPEEAWVLETAGRYWAAERVRGARAISNVYTIETAWDEASPDLVAHAVEMGWCNGERNFNFARTYGDYEVELAPRTIRYQRAQHLMDRDAGRITVETMMAYLRDHYDGSYLAPRWAPQELCFASLCMHTSMQYPGETASGIVAELRGGTSPVQSTIWHCFTSPCLSVFHPCYLGGVGLPEALDAGTGRYDAGSAWWVLERLHRRADATPALAPTLQSIWRPMERRWLDRAPALEGEARMLAEQGRPEEAQRVLRREVDAAVAEMLEGVGRADAALDRAEAVLERGVMLQPGHRAALNLAAGLPEDLRVTPEVAGPIAARS